MHNGHLPDRRAICSWSGGKDSCYAFIKAIDNGAKPVALLNVLNENGLISRSHGLPKSFLEAQARSMGLPITFASSTWEHYEAHFIEKLQQCKEKYALSEATYGDIDIESHREWEEKVSAAADLKAVLPLWQGDRIRLVREMIGVGIRAVIVSCNKELGTQFLGRMIDYDLINDLTEMGVDACGENGEYHTAVVDCPLFNSPISYTLGEKREHEHYCFIDINLTT